MNENLLKRTIKTDTKYNKYFKDNCSSTYLGSGNTDLSIRIMAQWVNKYKHQVKDLALKEFAGLTLENTVIEVYKFAHDYFQYKLDGNEQQIRSPYCSWLERKSGIDCKSYTVLISCILSNIGIVHYLTKIKQPGYAPNSFSHVYIRIPKDQKTNKLNNGYYIIDATIHNNLELPFLEAKNKIMSKVGLPHYGLGFAQTTTPTKANCGCNGNTSRLGFADTIQENQDIIFPAPGTQLIPTYTQYKTNDDSGFDWGAVADWVGGIFGNTCWGGTAYGSGELEGDINRSNTIFSNLTSTINEGIKNNQLGLTAAAVAQFEATANVMYMAFTQKKADKNWNSCSDKNLSNIVQLASTYKNKALPALKAYMQTFFNKVGTSNSITYNSNMLGNNNIWAAWVQPQKSTTVVVNQYTKKNKAIPRFEINSFIFKNPAVTQGNSSGFINTLTNIIVDAVGNNNGSTGNTPGYNDSPGSGNTSPGSGVSTNPNNNSGNTTGGYVQPTQTAGVGTVLAVGTAVAAAAYFYNKSKKSKK